MVSKGCTAHILWHHKRAWKNSYYQGRNLKKNTKWGISPSRDSAICAIIARSKEIPLGSYWYFKGGWIVCIHPLFNQRINSTNPDRLNVVIVISSFSFRSEQQERSDTTVSSRVSLKSDRSIGLPPTFKDGNISTEQRCGILKLITVHNRSMSRLPDGWLSFFLEVNILRHQTPRFPAKSLWRVTGLLVYLRPLKMNAHPLRKGTSFKQIMDTGQQALWFVWVFPVMPGLWVLLRIKKTTLVCVNVCLLLSFLPRQHQKSSKETSDISELWPATNQSDTKTNFMVCTYTTIFDFKCTSEMDIFT